MTEATRDPAPNEREHQAAIADLQALEHASSRDWQAVALGHAELDEVAAERANQGEDPAAIEQAKLLFRPYDELEQRRLLDALLGSVKPAARDRTRRRWMIGASLAAIAAALAITFVSLSGPQGSIPGERDELALLPDYAIETDPGSTSKRSLPGPEAAPLRYASANRFEWVLRPRTDVVGAAPWLGVVARDAHDDITRLALVPEIADSGSIRLSGVIAELGLAPGEWTIEFTLVRVSGWHVERVVVIQALTLEP